MYYNYSHVFLFLFIITSYVHANIQDESIKKRDDSSSTTTTTTNDYSLTTTTSTDAFASSTPTDAGDESTSPVNQDIYNSKDLFTREPNVTDINDVVQVKLYCEVDNTYCKKVQNSLIGAATRFSEVVNLKNKIVFQTSYYSFCKNRCSNTTFGWGTPSSQFTLNFLNAADSNFIYPQPLAKQLRQFTASSTNWADYDVSVDINHDIYMNAVNYDKLSDSTSLWNGVGIPPGGGFWFNNDTSSSIEDYQVDLEYVILHQMLHGLGMVSSWAPYFSDINSPFQQLLKGLIVPSDSLKVMTPSPYWFVRQHTGPAYITGFQPNMIFDKFLNLMIPAKNQTVNLVDYSFDMQSFCVQDHQAFIVNFMNAFLNNATQSSRAKSMYVSMSVSKTLFFQFNNNYNLNNNNNMTSAYHTNDYLNQTYKTMQLMTGPDILSPAQSQEAYYRPGISTSHVDDEYVGTPDFLMTHQFIRGKTLQSLVDDGYSNIPIIKYNVTISTNVNITTLVHNTTNHGNTSYYNVTTTEQRDQIIEHVYKSAIGPGILRILETIGYSTVLTNTNYTASVIKTNKPDTKCNDNNNNNFNARSDDSTPLSSTVSAAATASNMVSGSSFVLLLLIICSVLSY